MAACQLFEKGDIALPLFLLEMTTSCLQQCLCILTFIGQMEISNCLPTPHFLVPATPLYDINIYIYFFIRTYGILVSQGCTVVNDVNVQCENVTGSLKFNR